MPIHTNGFWTGKKVKSQHAFDKKLAECLTIFFKNEDANSLVDFGCGLGNYVKTFKDRGINAKGFDGNPNTLLLTNNLCEILDLSIPKKFDEPFEWVMSLEVGEHLPKLGGCRTRRNRTR